MIYIFFGYDPNLITIILTIATQDEVMKRLPHKYGYEKPHHYTQTCFPVDENGMSRGLLGSEVYMRVFECEW